MRRRCGGGRDEGRSGAGSAGAGGAGSCWEGNRRPCPSLPARRREWEVRGERAVLVGLFGNDSVSRIVFLFKKITFHVLECVTNCRDLRRLCSKLHVHVFFLTKLHVRA